MLTGSYYFGWGAVLLFVTVGILFLALPIVGGHLLRPSLPNRHKGLSYECGEQPIGDSWVRFNPRYYVIALIFVLFDVEIIFMYPWAVAFGTMKQAQRGGPGVTDAGRSLYEQVGIGVGLTEMLVFVAILLVGFVYLWRYGYLEWIRGVSPEPVED